MLKVTVTNLIFSIFLLSSIVSASITLQAPSSVVLQDSFTVSIAADTIENNDVKIYIRNDSDAILSEIKEGDWKNGRYYINDAYPQTKEFTLRAITFSNSAHLCAKLRLSEKRKTKPPTPESCTSINLDQSVTSPSKPSPQKTSTKEIVDEETPIKKSSSKKNISQQSSTSPPTQVQQSSLPQTTQEDIKEEKILLNTLSPTGKVIFTPEEKTHLGVMAAFFVFAAGILIWVVRQEKKKREQENI